ncbi:MAG TPA: hypothetical protein VKR27_05030 [Acidimicrobiales bacterium]|nr:hypothetical protein [Acidimicrobiales bacterium]
MTSRSPVSFERDLPPGHLELRARHLREEIDPRREIKPSRRGRRVTTRRLLEVVLAAAIVTPAIALRSEIASLFAATQPLVSPASAGMLPRGWQEFTNTPNVLTRQGSTRETIITSWHWQVDSGVGPGDAVPPSGVLIDIYLFRTAANWRSTNLCDTTPHLPGYPARKLPLRLPATTTFTSEGPPFMPEYRVLGRLANSYNYEIRVDINKPHPSGQSLALAQRIVSSIHFPIWPLPTSC